MSKGTDLTYNGVQLVNVAIREWNEEVKYDDSDTDVLYRKIVIHCVGLCNGAWNPTVAGADQAMHVNTTAVPVGNLGELYPSISHRLWQPRGNLVITLNGTQIFSCMPAIAVDCDPGGSQNHAGVAEADCNNGPKPREVRIEQIIADRVLRVSFTIECCQAICATGNDPNSDSGPNVVMDNRWSIAESFDDHFYCTRTIRGKLRMAWGSDLTNPAWAYKNLTVPRLELGFKRAAIDFQVSTDGLSAEYTVVDRQIHTAAPFPGLKISGHHSEATDDGVTFIRHCSCRLEGGPHSDKKSMLTVVMRVIDAKLNIVNRMFGVEFFAAQFEMADDFGEENVISASMTIRETGNGSSNANAAAGQDLYVKMAGVVNGLAAPLPSNICGAFNGGNPIPGLPAGYVYDPRKSLDGNISGYTTSGPQTGDGTNLTPGSARYPIVAVLLGVYLQCPCDETHALDTHQDTGTAGDIVTPGYMADVTGSVAPSASEGPPATDDNNFSEETKEGIYLNARHENRCEIDAGIVSLPIAAPAGSTSATSPTVKHFKMHRGCAQRIIRVDHERFGASPDIPEPVKKYTDSKSGIEMVLSSAKICPSPPVLDPSTHQLVYRTHCEYVYDLDRPPTNDEDMDTGALPYINYEAVQTQTGGSGDPTVFKAESYDPTLSSGGDTGS